MRVARVVLVAALLLGACNEGSGGGDDPLPPRPSSTSTTAPDYSVPAVIDIAYVEKVMAALDHVYGDAIRILAKERRITEAFLERLVAIYADRFYGLAQDAWVKDVAGGLQDLKPEPGDPLTTILRVEHASPDCIIAAVVRDFSQTRVVIKETPQPFIALIPLPPGRDQKNHNPTPWLIAYDGFTDSGAQPAEPCVRA